MASMVRSHIRVFPLAMWLIVALVAVAAVVVWAAFAQRLSSATPVPVASVPQPNAVVWHHRVYQSQKALARDLQRTGRAYQTWARNHPGAASLLASLELARTSPRRPTG